MKVSTQPYKGARDFYPEEKARQKWLFNTWRSVVEKYGYIEYDAPILEPTDLYLMKGSQEIVSEQTYTFTDRGDRSVTIRTEMTPSVSRMVAGRRQELAYPARWYSIPNLWRYERMQRGRLREFWQLNVDIFGVASLAAELELIQLSDDLMRAFNAKRKDYVIKINSRKLVNAVLRDYCELDDAQASAVIRIIDRMNKMDSTEFVAAIQDITSDVEKSKRIIDFVKADSIQRLPQFVAENENFKDILLLLEGARARGITNCVFDVSLMRGFDYYTDIVFEVFDTDPSNSRSMFGGGRYDGLVEQFGVEAVPTVGFGMGDVTFMNFLETHGLLPELKLPHEATILIQAPTATQGASKIAHDLREMGLNVAVDFTERKFDKQYKSAIKSGVPYIIVVGDEEIDQELYVLKDCRSGKEQKHSLQRIVSIVKDRRRK